jgi:putative transposase
MRRHELVGRHLRRRHRTTHRDPAAQAAPDLLGRDFTADRPDTRWVGDITYLRVADHFLYLATVLDLHSRRLVGWSLAEHARAELACDALRAAVVTRGGNVRSVIFHTDHGAQYLAIRYTERLAEAGIRPSMGSVGDSFDNALAENFFSTLKVELVYRTSFRTREEAELALFRYVDGWYNPHRIQKALGWRSPDEYEADYQRNLEAATPTGTK